MLFTLFCALIKITMLSIGWLVWRQAVLWTPEFESWQGQKVFLFFTESIRKSLLSNRIILGGNRQGRETEHIFQPSAEIKSNGIIPELPNISIRLAAQIINYTQEQICF
jgi:hypothetical protein